ncbi:MAG: RNA polymerase sigma factor [Planctomycetota bacterium]
MTDAELIALVLAGGREHYEPLVRRYYDRICALAMCTLFCREDAEEAAQETFLAAYLALGTLRDVDRFGAWLAGIVRRKAIYALRKKIKSRQKVEGLAAVKATLMAEDTTHADPFEDQVARERNAAIGDELRNIAPKYREVIYLRYFRDCSYQEIGDMLGMTQSGVDTRLQRARVKLEKRLRARGITI